MPEQFQWNSRRITQGHYTPSDTLSRITPHYSTHEPFLRKQIRQRPAHKHSPSCSIIQRHWRWNWFKIRLSLTPGYSTPSDSHVFGYLMIFVAETNTSTLRLARGLFKHVMLQEYSQCNVDGGSITKDNREVSLKKIRNTKECEVLPYINAYIDTWVSSEEKCIYARPWWAVWVLGLLGYMLIYAPSDASRDNIANDIINYPHFELAVPKESDDSDSDNIWGSEGEDLTPSFKSLKDALKHALLQKSPINQRSANAQASAPRLVIALIRDGHRCVLTGHYELESVCEYFDRRMEFVICATQAVHIIRSSADEELQGDQRITSFL
ncbi:uncharacterized protein EDB91DRAFT_1080477 [Suillus paluster]|uniref:uncharacterized protein n=1 Tax=Suillus paluster TaxID=48578 RepID=UPI001B86A528|nr:uncharacterized protein EDB91DRAFT_1080477 [Suillus paluster]KAG1744943.1 hypothetical protein EDB91DRAFT_1080477 [Suillus paluster]